ncbi:MAG: HAMP domain-containing histidine kinase [Chloroflexi bacterium]|nr:HAMP domain-containing histidine kinase [Chloroflexota bacterium]
MNQFGRIRWRLAAWNLAILALVLAITIGAALVTETRARAGAVDRELRLGAEREVAAFDHEGDDDNEGESRRRLGSGSDLFAFWLDSRGQVVRNSRQINLAGLPDAEAVRAALGGRETLADRDVGGVSVRLLTVPVYHDRRIDGVVQVGKPLAGGQQELTQLTTILLLTGAAGLVLSALGSLFLAGRAMRPIREAFERQRRFIADASHELRTPVAVLRARADVLQREATDLAPNHLEQVQALRHDADELSALLDELLDLARIDAGQIELPLEPVALADVAEELVAHLTPLASLRGVELRLVTKPVWGQANLGRLRQVVRALVDNALKHTSAGGSVEVAVDREGDQARLRVIDTGEGIGPEHLPNVTGRFYRADEARDRRGAGRAGGAGLGLAIAEELVRLMHGRLKVESEPGQGTCATVLLPVASGQGQPA